MQTERTATSTDTALDEHRANQRAWEGQRLLMAGENEAAVAALTDALKLNPKMLNTYRNRAEAYRCMGRKTEADADLRQADSLQAAAKSKNDEWRSRDVANSGGDGADAADDGGNAGMAVGIGLLMIVGGIIATIVSYSSAAPGETYTVWWGIIVVGVITLIKGLASSD